MTMLVMTRFDGKKEHFSLSDVKYIESAKAYEHCNVEQCEMLELYKYDVITVVFTMSESKFVFPSELWRATFR